jgi:pyridoxal phosphate enzyme (YggS family)
MVVASQTARQLSDVVARVASAAAKANRAQGAVRLVAVSKTKPVEQLKECYDAGHRDFGENYVQEMIEKVPRMPEDTRWHFIGHLQSNKCKALLEACPRLAMLETVDSAKLANKLNAAVPEGRVDALRVLVQVNTSGEASKHGVEPGDCVTLAKHIVSECPRLKFAGLMTIGMPDYTSKPENFETLRKCREEVCAALGMSESECELSMGMSGDFEAAIAMGSTNVRVGSTIFGARDYSKK